MKDGNAKLLRMRHINWSRLLVCSGASMGVVGATYLYVFLRWEFMFSDKLDYLAGIVLTPGMTIALMLFPAGIHAGIMFFLVSSVISWAFYSIVFFALAAFFQKKYQRK